MEKDTPLAVINDKPCGDFRVPKNDVLKDKIEELKKNPDRVNLDPIEIVKK